MDVELDLAVKHHMVFAFELFKTYLEQSSESRSNALLSPISIATAMAMAGAGARGNTLAEIGTVLKLPEGEGMHNFASQVKALLQDASGTGGPLLSFANGLWVDKSLGIKPKFQELLHGRYGAQARAADFLTKAEQERTAINSWAFKETKEKIEDLLPPSSLDRSTRLVLANALYFKGNWAKQFHIQATENAAFHLLNGETVNVPFLSSGEKQFIHKFEDYKILKLPYAQGEDHRSFSMYILLPNEKGGLPEVEKNLDAESLNLHLSLTNKEVPVRKFRLPRFKISVGFQVVQALKNLGMKAPFSQGADFSDIVEGPNAKELFISNVFQKCFIEVNEKGTEAAAATALVVMPTSLIISMDEPEDFVADHPFFFILREDISGLILFLGLVTNPSVE